MKTHRASKFSVIVLFLFLVAFMPTMMVNEAAAVPIEQSWSLTLSGYKWEDINADGIWDSGEEGLKDWTIVISGTGWNGEAIYGTVVTDEDGYWGHVTVYTAYENPASVIASLTISEVLQAGWSQSYPSSGTYTLRIEPPVSSEDPVYVADLNFGNVLQPVPEPATMLLLGSGLVGLVGIRRKLRK